MDTKVNYTIVGFFVILLLAAIVLTIIWLSAGFSFENYRTYKVYMQESVSGLTVDAPVEFNGVRVGKVYKIRLDMKNPNEVALLLSVKRSTPVTKGTVAILSTRGITGFVFITLYDKGENRSPVTLRPGERYPVIPTEPSIFVRLDTVLTKISSGFSHLDEVLGSLLSADNIESFKEILYSVKQFTHTLSQNTENINKILQNTSKASAKFTPFLNSTQEAVQTLETQTVPAVNQALSSIENVSRVMGELATQLEQNPSLLIRGRSTPAPGPGETGR